jgi:hypothetical protein
MPGGYGQANATTVKTDLDREQRPGFIMLAFLYAPCLKDGGKNE